MKKLSDIKISFISLVKDAANKKEVIFKNSKLTPTINKDITIQKNKEKNILYGVVYEPYSLDLQNEWSDELEIEKAMHNFMRARNTSNIDKEHSFLHERAFVCECYITKSKNKALNCKAGSWVVGIKIEDENLKQEIKQGIIKGISMAGFAKKTNENLEEGDNLDKELEKQIKQLQEKNEELLEEIKRLQEEIAKNKENAKEQRINDLIKSKELIAKRKENALKLDGENLENYLEVCKSEAIAIFQKNEIKPDSDNEISLHIKKQLGIGE